MIELEDVTQHYGVRPVLRGINLRIERGEVVVILGPNGMGKSTLAGGDGRRAVAPAGNGDASTDKRRRGSEEEELAIRKMTVYLPDQPWLPASRTGREFLLAVGRLYDVEEERLIEHVDPASRLCSTSQTRPTARSGRIPPGRRRRSRFARRS